MDPRRIFCRGAISGLVLTPFLACGCALQKHDFKSVSDFKGASLPYFTTHTDLVARPRAAIEAKKQKAGSGVVGNDAEWRGETFVQQSEDMVAN